MKNFLTKKVLPILGVVLMMASVMATPAFAVETQYTAVAGGTPSFTKNLILDADANVPDMTFSYQIAPGAAIPAASGKMAVLAGPTGATIGSADYNPGDTTTTTAPTGVTLASGQKVAVKTVSVDLTGVSFNEPGIYRYLITEQENGAAGVSYDTQRAETTNGVAKQRTLDVYVTDDNGALQVEGYVIHELVNDITAGTDFGSNFDPSIPVSDKSIGFVNGLATYDLTISKAVSGNQASKDKYFKFTVAITDAGANAALDVDWSAAALAPTATAATVYAAADMAAANGADDNATLDGKQWVASAAGAVTKDIYLQHGQSITIKGLAAGAKYTITELPEDYKSSATENKIEDTTGMAADATAAFTNTRNGTVPTGIILSVVPGVALIGAAGAGIAALASKKKKEENDD